MTLDARLLAALRAAEVHYLPGDLATQLRTPLSEIETSLAGLIGAGFIIENRPGLGLRLLASPDRLLADDLHARLGGSCACAREIIVFAETSSTNDVALRLGREGHAGNVAILAERQTSGRGRFGRKWESAAHLGLWMSVLLRPPIPFALWPRLTTMTGVAVAQAVDSIFPAHIKWPNDVLLGGHKTAGILIESATDSTGAPFAVIGIGINVNHTGEDFPPELAGKATSLRLAGGERLERADVAVRVLRAMEGLLERISSDFPAILREATRRSAILGRWIHLSTGGNQIEGTAEMLDEDGQLLLRTADGTLYKLGAGEVTSQVDR